MRHVPLLSWLALAAVGCGRTALDSELTGVGSAAGAGNGGRESAGAMGSGGDFGVGGGTGGGHAGSAGMQIGSEHPWPMAARDRRRTGRSEFVGSVELTQRWFVNVSNGVGAPLLAKDGTIYLTQVDGRIHAVAPEGAIAWTAELGRPILTSPALSPRGTLYVLAGSGSSLAEPEDQGMVFALRTGDEGGAVLWSKWVGGALRVAPSVDQRGSLYFTNSAGTLHAISEDGTLEWSAETGPGSVAIADDGTVYAAGTGVHAFDDQGRPTWSYLVGQDVSPATIGDDGTLYVVAEDGLHAITPEGKRYWRFSAQGFWQRGLALAPDGSLYFMVRQEDRFLVSVQAVNPDGSSKWLREHLIRATGGLSVGADGTVFVPTSARLMALTPDGEVVAMPPAVESLRAELRAEASIGADGTVYAVSNQGRLVALGGGGACEGALRDCDDRDPCTRDRCDNVSGCVHTKTCDDQNPCTLDGCDQDDGACVHEPVEDGAACDLGYTCALGGSCEEGVCQPEIDECALQRGGFPIDGVDNQRTSRSPHPLSARPAVSWSQDIQPETSFPPLVGADGSVYVQTRYRSPVGYQVLALNPDGSERWNVEGRGPVALRQDGSLLIYADGLSAITPDGRVDWSFRPLNGLGPVAVATDGTIYLSGTDYYLHALAADGREKWRFDGGHGRYRFVSLSEDDLIYVATQDTDGVYGLNPDGSVRWWFPTDDPPTTLTVDPEGTVYFGAGNALHAVSSQGDLKWPPLSDIAGPVALADDGTLWARRNSSTLVRVTHDGRPFDVALGQPITGRIALARDDTLVTVSSTLSAQEGFISYFAHEVLAFTPEGGLLWTVPLEEAIMEPGNAFALGPGGSVLVTSGALHALGL